MTPHKQLRLFALIIAAGFVGNVIFSLLRHHGFFFPYSNDSDPFGDFIVTYQNVKNLTPYLSTQTTPGGIYFPLAFLVIFPFTIFHVKLALTLFFLLLSAFIFGLFYYYTKNIKEYFSTAEYCLTIASFYLSYPFLYSLQRGNIEIILFMLIAFFLILFQKKKYYSSSILLAIAIGMKLYPAVFLVLFWKEKQYKASIICVLVTIMLSLMALLSFQGSVMENLSLYSSNMSSFNQGMALNKIFNSLSLFMIPKLIMFSISSLSGHFDLEVFSYYMLKILPYYAILTMGSFILIMLYILRIEMEFWKNVFLLVCVMLLFPTISFNYKLLHMLPVFLIFIHRTTPFTKFDTIYTLLFSLLFINKISGTFTGFSDILIMLIMIGLIFYEAFTSAKNKRLLIP